MNKELPIKPHLANLTLSARELKKSYLSFIEGGGLFIPSTEKNYYLGEELFLKVDLEGTVQPYRLIGKIVWITTHADEKEWPPGVGIQFQDEEGEKLNREIQAMLNTLKEKRKPC